MLLAIDAGNTSMVFAVFSDVGSIAGEWRMATHPEKTSDELSLWLGQVFEKDSVAADKIDSAIIATVVPAMLEPLKDLCQRHLGVTPLVVGEDGTDPGIGLLVDSPAEVGADRIANAVAAGKKYGGRVVVVDFGTATNFDIVDDDGNYIGGIIAPGINLSLDALHSAAAKLPNVAPVKPERVIGRSTVSAMQSGIYWGYVSLIEGLVQRIQDEMGGEVSVVATGGLAYLFSEGCKSINRVDPVLTLEGLFAIARNNGTGNSK